jgi:hypothetical protein
MIDIKKIEDLEVDGVDSRDYPDFCDAFFAHGIWIETSKELTEDELIELSDTHQELLNEMAYESLI